MNQLTNLITELTNTNPSVLTTGEILASLLITLVISLFIYQIYKRTYAGVAYSKEFNVTLVIISLVMTVIMLGISRNLVLSLGLIGALSIVRFRNAIKDPKDVAFIFWSISIGIVNGVHFFKLAIISSIFIGIVLIIISKQITNHKNFVLAIKGTANLNKIKVKKIISRNSKKFNIQNNSFNYEENELIYEVQVNKNAENKLLDELRQEKEISSASIFSHSGNLGE